MLGVHRRDATHPGDRPSSPRVALRHTTRPRSERCIVSTVAMTRSAWLGSFVVLLVLAAGSTGCASLEPLEGSALGATFPGGPGRTYYLKKSLFGTTILVCDGGPRDAVCFEKPN